MNILITGAWRFTKKNILDIESLGHRVIILQYEKDSLPCGYEEIDAVICNGLFLYHPIEKFKKLKYIQLTSAGYDRVPMEYIKANNIKIYNAKGVYSIPIAEFVFLGVLQLYKNSRYFYKNQENHEWKKYRDIIEIYDKVVCIVGCGSVGTECAKRFKAFGCRVVGVDLYSKVDENYDYIIGLKDLEILLPKSDVIILTLPLTCETKHFMNEKRLKFLKQDAILVNVARGAIIDTNALINVLPNLGGAVLDVFEEEPLASNSLLWNMENVVITPHNSFVGEGNRKRLQNIIFKNIIALDKL